MFLDSHLERFYNPERLCGHGSVVERLLPKQNVAGSNPAARSKRKASKNTLEALSLHGHSSWYAFKGCILCSFFLTPHL